MLLITYLTLVNTSAMELDHIHLLKKDYILKFSIKQVLLLLLPHIFQLPLNHIENMSDNTDTLSFSLEKDIFYKT